MSRKVVVLLGGMGSEREISLVTGRECAAALARKGWDVTQIDPGHDLAGKLVEVNPEVVFNALHGEWGEDGRVQGLLDYLGFAYTHSGVAASSLAMDKQKTKAVLETVGIACPRGVLVSRFEAAQAHVMKPPYVVKPNAQGSSVGVVIVPALADTPPQELLLPDWPYEDEVLVEEYIDGRELTVGVMAGARDGSSDTRALCVTEIVAHQPFYNYQAKYEDGGSKHICPARLDDELTQILMKQAVLAHKTLGCAGVTRSDFRWDEKNNWLRLLEINTQPGMTSTSLVPEQAASCKISFDDLVVWMAENANDPKQAQTGRPKKPA